MKNWFMSKSAAVRAAVVVLILALLVQAGVGVFLLAKNLSSDKSSVASISDSVDTVADASVQEEEPAKTVKEPEVEIVTVDKEEDEEENVTLTYYNKSTTNLENGDFSDGLNAWEVYSYVLDNIEYKADDCFEITMQETGTENWHVQLKQTGIRLEKGKWYTISLDAKSDINRSILCSMQRDGMIHNDDWTPYASEKELKLSSKWNTYTFVFKMLENTDDESVFNLALGAVNGAKISKEHTVSIDNVSLTKLPDNWMDALKTGDNLVGNPIFEYEDTMWDASVVAPGAASVSFAGNKATFDITNVGTVDWHVQLKQAGIQLDNNTGYRMTFNVSSSCARTIKLGFMDTEYVNWYGGGDIVLNGTDNQEVTVDFYNSLGTDSNALLMLSMGKIDGVATPAGKISFSNFKLAKCSDVAPGTGGGSGNGDWTDPNHQLSNGWVAYDHESSHTKYIYESNGTINFDIVDTGSEDWHVQLQNKSISLKQGNYYKISYEVKSTIPRNIGVAVQKDGSSDNDWTPYTSGSSTQAVTTRWKKYEKTFKMNAKSDNNAIYNFSLGTINGEVIKEEHVVSLRNIKIEKVSAPEVPDPEINVGDDILKNGDFSSSSNWESGIYADGRGDISFENGKAVIKVTNPGTDTWHIQLKQTPVKIEKGAKYEITLVGTSTVERTVKVDFLDGSNTSNWYGGADITLSPASVGGATADKGDTHKATFTMAADTDKEAIFAISMGKVGSTPNSTIVLDSVSVVKIEDPEPPVETTEVTLDVDPENTEQYKGTLVEFDSLEEFVPDYIGKDIKVSVKIVATGYFGGVIGGMSDGSWKTSDQFSAGSAGTYTWSYVIKKASGGAKVDIYWSQKQKIEYYDLKFEVVEGSEDPENPEEEPWLIDLTSKIAQLSDGADISGHNGKKVKITVVLNGDAAFNGAIGGGSEGAADNWYQGATCEGAANTDSTWETVIENFLGYGQVQIYWCADGCTKIEIKSVTIEEVSDADPENPEDPGEEPWLIDLTSKIAQLSDGADISGHNGKKVKITVVLNGDAAFNGAIGGGSEGAADNWYQGATCEGAANTDSTWETVIENFLGYGQVQIYWCADGCTKIEIKSVTIEEIADPLGAANADAQAESKAETAIVTENKEVTDEETTEEDTEDKQDIKIEDAIITVVNEDEE